VAFAKVRSLINDIPLVDGDLNITQIAKIMAETETTEKGEIGAVLVVRKGCLGDQATAITNCPSSDVLGILTARDLLTKVLAKGLNPRRVRGSEVMNSPVITISADESVENAAEIMRTKRVGRLVVLHGGKVIGLVKAKDLVTGGYQDLPRK